MVDKMLIRMGRDESPCLVCLESTKLLFHGKFPLWAENSKGNKHEFGEWRGQLHFCCVYPKLENSSFAMCDHWMCRLERSNGMRCDLVIVYYVGTSLCQVRVRRGGIETIL